MRETGWLALLPPHTSAGWRKALLQGRKRVCVPRLALLPDRKRAHAPGLALRETLTRERLAGGPAMFCSGRCYALFMEIRQSPPEPERSRVWQPQELVLRGLRPEDADLPVDWSSWYLTDEEDMGEGAEQSEIIRILLSALSELARERRWTRVFCGRDQFFAWVPSEPLVRVSPDVYLIDDPPARPFPDSWQTWLPGHRPPRFAVEVVSQDRKKDYAHGPLKYAQLGAQELVIFDPAGTPGAELSRRIPLQLSRRNAAGAFLRVYAGPGPVHSAELDAHLVVQREGGVVRLRLARDAAGRDLVPTAEEAREEAEMRAAQEAGARRKAEEAYREAENRGAQEEEARRKAEARLRELEEMIAKLRG
jgi:Uma2 family endonuclease